MDAITTDAGVLVLITILGGILAALVLNAYTECFSRLWQYRHKTVRDLAGREAAHRLYAAYYAARRRIEIESHLPPWTSPPRDEP